MGQKRGSGTVPRYKCIKNGLKWVILGEIRLELLVSPLIILQMLPPVVFLLVFGGFQGLNRA